MLFAHDKSQTCNNLLQFAHVYAWAREHGRSVVSMQFSYKNAFFHIRNTKYANFWLYIVGKYAALLHLIPTASFKTKDCDPVALEKKMLRHRHIVVFGWFVRYYDLFLKYRDEICKLFAIDEEYTKPVEEMMAANDAEALAKTDGTKDGTKDGIKDGTKDGIIDATTKVIRLGVHIRRGDYAQWCGGVFYHEDDVYMRHINQFKQILGQDAMVHVYISTNDPYVDAQAFQKACPDVTIFHPKGKVPEDLHMLSQCDYIIGPPSTFSLVASMYRDIPFYRMSTKNEQDMTPEGFHLFDYWFRRINDL